MTRAQRIVAVLYCLAVVCCCVWVPWHATAVETEEIVTGLTEERVENARLGYDWVWSIGGPRWNYDESNTRQANESNLIMMKWHRSATPDVTIIALTVLATTATGVAAFLLAGKWKSISKID
jgi:hypothetical protein